MTHNLTSQDGASNRTNFNISKNYAVNKKRLYWYVVRNTDFVLNTSTTLPKIADIEQTKQINQ